MFRFTLKYPLTLTLCLCLLLSLTAGIFFNGAYINESECHYILILSLFILYSKNIEHFIVPLIGGLLFLGLHLLFNYSILLLFGEMFLVLGLYYMQPKNVRSLSFTIIALSFLMHLYYIEHIPADSYQHDLSGVLYYMSSITKNGIDWKNFNPWNMYYLFHQPLYFIVMGYIHKLFLLFWDSGKLALELLQYTSLFFVTATSILAARIFYIIKIKKKYYYFALLLFSFHPTLFLFSGYISDDTCVLFCITAFVYFTLSWYFCNNIKYIIYAALCFGMGCLTKLSILMCVPAAAFLFLYKLYASSDKQKVLSDLCLFAIVTIPLSLLWIIRNHILFDMQFYNIPDTSPSGQNFRYLSFADRILDFSTITMPFINVPAIVENNIWLAIIKTELFGEWNLSIHNSIIFLPAYLLYILNILIKITSLAGCFFVIGLLRYKKSDAFNLFFVLLYLFTWGYSFKYAMEYPYACSSDYRLFSVLLLAEIIIISTFFQNLKIKTPYLYAVALGYALCVSFIYIAIV